MWWRHASALSLPKTSTRSPATDPHRASRPPAPPEPGPTPPLPGLRDSLERHQFEATAAFDALHASQKNLTASLRRLLNALDDLSALSAPRVDAAALEQLRAAAGRARALQAQLRGIAARLDRVEGVLGDLRQRGER
jgi:hypothetical protein